MIAVYLFPRRETVKYRWYQFYIILIGFIDFLMTLLFIYLEIKGCSNLIYWIFVFVCIVFGFINQRVKFVWESMETEANETKLLSGSRYYMEHKPKVIGSCYLYILGSILLLLFEPHSLLVGCHSAQNLGISLWQIGVIYLKSKEHKSR